MKKNNYKEEDLVVIAKRENNTKRTYLVVNKLQGKHIPVSPSKALAMFDTLADILKNRYQNEKVLFVGFAETATAIGARVANTFGGIYIQTTREKIPDVDYLFFTESHSHATAPCGDLPRGFGLPSQEKDMTRFAINDNNTT